MRSQGKHTLRKVNIYSVKGAIHIQASTSETGDFQGSCHSWATIQAAWIKGSAGT